MTIATPQLSGPDRRFMRRVQWRQMLAALPLSNLGGLSAGVILAATLYLGARTTEALVWLAALAVLSILRVVLWRRYGRAAVLGRKPLQARRILLAGVVLSGLLWGAGILWFAPGLAIEHLALICFFAGGMTAGAAASLSVVPWGFEAFSAPLLTLTAVALLSAGSPTAYAMAAALILFAGFMLLFARTNLAQTEESLALWLVNRRLAADLKGAQRREAAAEEKAETSALAVATAAHELRTPLNAVIGFSDMIAQELHGPLGDPRYREYATDISLSAADLRALVDDLLQRSRQRLAPSDLQLEPVSAARVIEDVVRAFAAGPAAGRLQVFVSPPDLALNADRRLVFQILRNLVENAVKFAEPISPIQVEAGPSGDGKVRLAVRNRGPGIPTERLELVQRPFVQGDQETASKEGVGLGLALVKQFAALHGGSFTIESTPGEGVTAIVNLPRA